MPIPIPPPSDEEVVIPMPSPGGVGIQERPYYIREPQDWQVEQERARHNQALYMIGEWVFIVLMWHQLDFERGLVAKCTRCFAGSAGAKDRRIAEVYQQPRQNECPVCFGTTFEGGYRARIVRPAIVADVEETEKQDRRGSMHPAAVTFETTIDFRTRTGDYVFRADGSRWRIQSADRLQVRTGFEPTGTEANAVAYKLQAGLEETSTVAYKLPPVDQLQVRGILSQAMRFPADFGAYEHLGGPLIPPSILD
jgi:hypothetical protein